MKGLLYYPEMLDNSNSSHVLTNSNVGHLIAYQVHALSVHLLSRCWFFWCEYEMFYFRRAESCSLWLITHNFTTATVSGSPLPLQQTHKIVGKVHLVQAGQVKHECNCFQMWCRSLVWGVCVCVRVYGIQKHKRRCPNVENYTILMQLSLARVKS